MNRIPANRYVVVALLTAAALAIDLSSKSVVFADLGYPGAEARFYSPGNHTVFSGVRGHEGESAAYVDGWLTFRLLTSFNRGALWGFGQRLTWVFAALSLAAVIAVPLWLFVFGAARSLWLTIALSLVLGGTLGNLYDRFALHGYRDSNGAPIAAVRDFLLFTFGEFHWPVFNFADMCLVTGACMLVVHSFFATGEADDVSAGEPRAPLYREVSGPAATGAGFSPPHAPR